MSVKVSQKRIARKLNISIATVSKSLNNVSAISPQTRSRVIASARQMGYKLPGRYKRLENKNRIKPVLIGQLIMSEGNSPKEWGDVAAMGYASGMSQTAQAMNASMVTHHISLENCDKICDPKFQSPALRQGLLSGMILVHYFHPKAVRELALKMPVVTIAHRVSDTQADHIEVDQIDGISRLVDHLYHLGHRRIGFVSHPAEYTWVHLRFAAYLYALRQHKLSYDPDMVYQPCNSAESELDMEAQSAFVSEKIKEGVTAWVCANDFIAYNLCYHLISKGIRVPQDVSVVGFDAIEPRLGCPKLTTISVPFYDIGALAVSQLMKRIENPTTPPRQIMLSGKFVEGQSTASPLRCEIE